MKNFINNVPSLKDIINQKHQQLINDGYVLDDTTLSYSKDEITIKYSEFIRNCEATLEVDGLAPALHHNVSKINSIIDEWDITEDVKEVNTGSLLYWTSDVTINVLGWDKHNFNSDRVNGYCCIEGLSDRASNIVNLILSDINTGLSKVDLRNSNVNTLLSYLGPVLGRDLIADIKSARQHQHDIHVNELFTTEDEEV
nr:MAG TPA: hypothetical protein [Caudoviricetes sp.]